MITLLGKTAWYENECTPKTYGSDSFEEENPLPEADLAQLTKKFDGSIWSLSDSWSDSMGIVELHCDKNIGEVEFVENLKLTEKVIHGITDSGLESEGEACSAPLPRLVPLQRRRPNPKVVVLKVCLTLWLQSQRTRQRRLATPHVTKRIQLIQNPLL